MRASIEIFVRGCQKCLCTNDCPKLVAPLSPYSTSRPLEIVACDLVDIGASTSGNRYMLTIIDLFTKFGTAIPIPDKKGETVLKAFIDRWAIGEGRIPETLLTDQGKEFLNENFKKFTSMLNINHVTTKGYNSRANGCVERFNKTITHIIKKKNRVAFEWDEQVAFAVFAYNSVSHETTGESPLFLMTGRDPTGGLEKSEEDACGRNYVDMDEYKNVMVQGLNQAFEMVRTHAMKEQEEYKRLFDEKHNTERRKYPNVGSRVVVEIPSEKLGARCPKMVNKWKGPYRVVDCSQNSVTVVPVSGNSREQIQVPHEHVRVVPDQMDDTLIETKKGRARVPSDTNKNTVSLLEIAPNNDYCSFSKLLHCRCERRCVFILKWNPNGNQGGRALELRSSSPTHLAVMSRLLEMNPDLSPEMLFALSQGEIPSMSTLPPDSLWPVLCACPSFFIWVTEILGWSKAYRVYHTRLLQTHLGEELLNEVGTTVVMLPGVRATDVCIPGIEQVQLEGEYIMEVVQEIAKKRVQHAILIVPFFSSEDTKDEYQTVVDMFPVSVKLTIVPGYTAKLDYSEVPQFCHLFGRLTRAKGELETVLPEDRVSSKQNQTLINIPCTAIQYWDNLRNIVKDRKMWWPKEEPSSSRTLLPTPDGYRDGIVPGPMRTHGKPFSSTHSPKDHIKPYRRY